MELSSLCEFDLYCLDKLGLLFTRKNILYTQTKFRLATLTGFLAGLVDGSDFFILAFWWS